MFTDSFALGQVINVVIPLLYKIPSTDAKLSFSESTLMLAKLLQYPNAQSPILATFSGIVMLVKSPQLRNAKSPILVTLLGMVILVNSEQLIKAPFPIVVTPSDIVMLVNS